MINTSRFISVVALGILASTRMWAVPANPDLFTAKQLSGEPVLLRMCGDEHGNWYEDPSGYLTMKAASGAWVYAQVSQGKVVPTPYLVSASASPQYHGIPRQDGVMPATSHAATNTPSRLMSRTGSAAGSLRVINPIGTLKNLVILVTFSDVSVPYPLSDYESLFNDPVYDDGTNRCSVNGYFQRVSRGQLAVQSTIYTVTLPHTMAYYGADIGDIDPNVAQMAEDAITALDPTVDFSQFDGDGDGVVDGLDVIHAGLGQEYSGNSSDCIWSQQSEVGWPGGMLVDGVKITKFHTESAQRGWDGYPLTYGITTVGIICHEFMHVLDMPDLYDYTYISDGVGSFCLMANGAWRGLGGDPCDPSAFIRMKLGWIIPVVADSSASYQLKDVDINNGPIIKVPIEGSKQQYFLLESCNRLEQAASQGVLVWHVDEGQSTNDDRGRLLVDLEEASGVQHLYDSRNSGESSDLFSSADQVFSSSSVPNNLGYDGQSCQWSLRNFRNLEGDYWLDLCPASMILTVKMPDLLTGSEIAGRQIAVDYLDVFGSKLASDTLTLDALGVANSEPIVPSVNVRVSSVNYLGVRLPLPANGIVNAQLIGGDVDGNGSVDLFDLVQIDIQYGLNSIAGDIDGDGTVNMFDYVVVDRNFGARGE